MHPRLTPAQESLLLRIASARGGWREVRARRSSRGRERAGGARESTLAALVAGGLIELRSDGAKDVERGRTVLDRNWFARLTPAGAARVAARRAGAPPPKGNRPPRRAATRAEAAGRALRAAERAVPGARFKAAVGPNDILEVAAARRLTDAESDALDDAVSRLGWRSWAFDHTGIAFKPTADLDMRG